MAHRSCFIQHGVPNPMSCFAFVQWICIEQITCYMLGYRGQKETRSLPSRVCILLVGEGRVCILLVGVGRERQQK